MCDKEVVIGVKVAGMVCCVDARWFVMNVTEEVMWGGCCGP